MKDSLNAYPIPAFFSKIWEGHSLPSFGHEMVGILKSSSEQENKRELRSILDTVKGIKNYFASFEGKINLILKLCGKKMSRFINRNKKILSAILFGLTLAALIGCVALATIGIGFLAPLMVALTQWLSSQAASVALMSGAAVFASAGLTSFKVIPKALSLVFNFGMAVLGKIYSLFALTAILLLSTPSIIKNGAKALYKDPQPLKDFGKYLLRLQFIPDLVLGVIKGAEKVVEGLYILAACAVKYCSHQCRPAERRGVAQSSIHSRLNVTTSPPGEEEKSDSVRTAGARGQRALISSSDSSSPPLLLPQHANFYPF